MGLSSDFSPYLNEMHGYPPYNPPSFIEFEKDYEAFYFKDSSLKKGADI